VVTLFLKTAYPNISGARSRDSCGLVGWFENPADRAAAAVTQRI
jgi:hypothetical protein